MCDRFIIISIVLLEMRYESIFFVSLHRILTIVNVTWNDVALFRAGVFFLSLMAYRLEILRIIQVCLDNPNIIIRQCIADKTSSLGYYNII
jgi:hypothetical protein